MAMTFKREKVHGPSQRTGESYSCAGSTSQFTVAHAPEFEDFMREIANALTVEGDLTPLERADRKLQFLQRLRQEFLYVGSREAVDVESEVRAQRPPAAATVASEPERLAAAKAALTRNNGDDS